MSNVLYSRRISRAVLGRWFLVIILPLISSTATLALTPSLEDETDDSFLGIAGLLVDETRTIAGRRFFEGLATQLTDLEGQTENIVVTELADPRFGSRLSVNVGPTLVFQKFLSPRLGDVDKAVELAVSQIHRALNMQQQIQQALEMY